MSTREPGRRRRWLLAIGCGVAGLLAVDLARPPGAQWSNRAALAAVGAYRASRAPHAPRRCRFTPSCSEYAQAVLARDGALVGGARVAWRLVRCAPWTPRGTVDLPEPGPVAAPAPEPSPTRSPGP